MTPRYCVQSYNPHDPADQSGEIFNQFFTSLKTATRQAKAEWYTMDGRRVSLYERKGDRWELKRRWP